MYKRPLRFLMSATVGAVLIGAPVFAQVAPTLSDAHIEQIRSSCQEAKITLTQIHANDAPTYINLNQTYFSISDKLMARLNSRLTLNRYDATQLVKTASEYNTNLAKFRVAYRTYNDAMAEVLQINCTKKPTDFYNTIARARDARLEVNTITKQLTANIEQYAQQVQTFKTQHAKALSDGGKYE